MSQTNADDIRAFLTLPGEEARELTEAVFSTPSRWFVVWPDFIKDGKSERQPLAEVIEEISKRRHLWTDDFKKDLFASLLKVIVTSGFIGASPSPQDARRLCEMKFREISLIEVQADGAEYSYADVFHQHKESFQVILITEGVCDTESQSLYKLLWLMYQVHITTLYNEVTLNAQPHGDGSEGQAQEFSLLSVNESVRRFAESVNRGDHITPQSSDKKVDKAPQKAKEKHTTLSLLKTLLVVLPLSCVLSLLLAYATLKMNAGSAFPGDSFAEVSSLRGEVIEIAGQVRDLNTLKERVTAQAEDLGQVNKQMGESLARLTSLEQGLKRAEAKQAAVPLAQQVVAPQVAAQVTSNRKVEDGPSSCRRKQTKVIAGRPVEGVYDHSCAYGKRPVFLVSGAMTCRKVGRELLEGEEVCS